MRRKSFASDGCLRGSRCLPGVRIQEPSHLFTRLSTFLEWLCPREVVAGNILVLTGNYHFIIQFVAISKEPVFSSVWRTKEVVFIAVRNN